MSEESSCGRRSFLKGVGASGVVGVGVFAATNLTGGSSHESVLRVRGREDGTRYHAALSDESATKLSGSGEEVVSHKQGKTFVTGKVDAGDVDTYGFSGGIERVDLSSGQAGFLVDGATGNFTGAARAMGHGFYRFAATEKVSKAKGIEAEEATMTDTAQGTVDGDEDAFEVDGAIQYIDLNVVKGQELALAHSFARK